MLREDPPLAFGSSLNGTQAREVVAPTLGQYQGQQEETIDEACKKRRR